MRLVPDVYSKPEKIRTLVDSVLSELRGLPGIEAASAVRRVPLNGHSTTSTNFRTDTGSGAPMVTYNGNYVTPGYFKTMQISIVRGREFVNEDRLESPRVAILNENMAAKLFGKIDPVGHSVRFGKDGPVLIVGVAANSRYFTIGERDALAYYEPYAQWKASEVNVQFLVRASSTPEPLIPHITGILSRLDPTAALETKPMKRALAFALLPSRVGAVVLGSTGLLGLILAAVGLYGLLAYSVSRRIREIGVRMALGATPGGVLRLVLLKGVALVGTGSAIGVTIAIFAVRTLVAFLMPNVHPTNPVTFLVVSSALCLVGLLAAVAPAVRALRLDPAVALRND
jgi:predicted permease